MGQGVKERILEAAEKLFFERGYEATGIRDIAAAAGVNSAMIHYYFGGKRNLYKELLSSHLDVLASQISRIEAEDEREFIKRFMRLHIEILRKRGPRLAVIMMRELSAKTEVGKELFDGFMADLGEVLGRVISSGKEKGFFRRDLLDRLILVFLIHVDALLAIRFPEVDLDEAVELAYTLFMNGVGE